MNCLCCDRPLLVSDAADATDATDIADTGWHRTCIRAFFRTDSLPSLEITNDHLAELARQAVVAGRTVAGVQRKLSIHLSREGGPSRLTLVGYPAGYILKPPTPDYPQLPEIEHLTMSLARIAGIATVPHALIPLSDGALAYITRRVDRRGSTPYGIPMEDLCQLSQRLTEDKYRGSYEQAGKVIARYSSQPGIDLTEFFLLVVFSFAVGNADMHLKNFSLYRPRENWILAPAYDLLSTHVVIPDDPDEVALTLNGRKRKLAQRDFLALGSTIGVHPKAAAGLIDSVIQHRVDFLTSINRSRLAPERRILLQALVEERIDRLAVES